MSLQHLFQYFPIHISASAHFKININTEQANEDFIQCVLKKLNIDNDDGFKSNKTRDLEFNSTKLMHIKNNESIQDFLVRRYRNPYSLVEKLINPRLFRPITCKFLLKRILSLGAEILNKDQLILDRMSYMIKTLIKNKNLLFFDPWNPLRHNWNQSHPHKFHLFRQEFLQELFDTRIDVAKLLLHYGCRITKKNTEIDLVYVSENDNENLNIEEKQLHLNTDENKLKLWKNLYVNIKKIVFLESLFREKILSFNDNLNTKKDLFSRFINYPDPALWLKRIIKLNLENDENIRDQKTIYDHIRWLAPYCDNELQNILKKDDWNKKERKKTRKLQSLHIFFKDIYPNFYEDKAELLGNFVLKIVERGYYQKEKEYKELRPFLLNVLKTEIKQSCKYNKKCQQKGLMCQQNGNTGNIFHLLGSGFDNELMYYITSEIKNECLMQALDTSCILPNGFNSVWGKTPLENAKNLNNKEFCEIIKKKLKQEN